jgi:predicted phage tail protein
MTARGIAALLRDIVDALVTLGITHMVVGSVSAMAHGSQRSTLDIDIVIDPTGRQLDQLLGHFDPGRYYVDADVARDALRHRSMFNVIDQQTGWKLDLIIRKARPFSVEELARRTKATIDGIDVDTATAEDTIIAKLEWAKAGASERQLEDISAILRLRGDTLDRLYIGRWVDELELREQWVRAQSL